MWAHKNPVAEMKRIYYLTAQRLGHRDFSQVTGPDVVELKRMLHAAGLWRPILETFPEPPTFDVDPGLKREDPERFQDLLATYREKADAFEEAYGAYDQEAVEAVDAFRHDHGMEYQGNPRGLVDARLVNALREVHYKRAKP